MNNLIEESKKGLSRREFFKDVLRTFLVIAGLGIGLREAWAQDFASGKPLLTDENLNAFIMNNANSLPNYYEEARANLGVFLEKYFTLTPSQKDYFNKFYQRDKSKWDDFFNKIESGVKSSTRIKNPPRIKTYPRARVEALPGGATLCGGDKSSGCCILGGTVKVVWGTGSESDCPVFNK